MGNTHQAWKTRVKTAAPIILNEVTPTGRVCRVAAAPIGHCSIFEASPRGKEILRAARGRWVLPLSLIQPNSSKCKVSVLFISLWPDGGA